MQVTVPIRYLNDIQYVDASRQHQSRLSLRLQAPVLWHQTWIRALHPAPEHKMLAYLDVKAVQPPHHYTTLEVTQVPKQLHFNSQHHVYS